MAKYSSKIITDENNFAKLLLLLPKKYKINLIYRGSEDGFTAAVFHEKCDHKGPTLIIIKSEFDKIFGAFTDIDWNSPT